MRNKLITTALVLGFSIAPISAFADSVTTIQGGTPTYSCPEGSQIVDTDKCLTPATTRQEQQEVPGQTIPATPPGTIKGPILDEFDNGYSCSTWTVNYYRAQTGRQGDLIVECYKNDGWGSHITGYQGITTTEYSCPNNYTLNGTNCVAPSTYTTVTVPVPATTTPATVSGASGGGSLVASITGFFTPVWNFLTGRLLPAITALVVLAIGVRLSTKAVRKFSKVA